RLGGPGRHQDLAVRVVVERVVPALVIGHGAAKLGDAGARRVLVVARPDRLDRRLEQLRRPVGVREPLPEVDRPGGPREIGHLGEDRRPEAFQASVEHSLHPATVQRAPAGPLRRTCAALSGGTYTNRASTATNGSATDVYVRAARSGPGGGLSRG